jgi:hypothetical protein
MTVVSTNRSERRFDRGAWLVLAGILGLAGVVLTVTLLILAMPSDGWQILDDETPVVLDHFFGDWPTPLQAGDEPHFINGVDITTLYYQDQGDTVAWRAGATIPYSLVRDGQPLEVPVELHPMRPALMLRALAHTAREDLFEWSWSLIALFVFWRRPRSLAARLLLVAMVPHNVITKLGWAAATSSAVFAPLGLRLLQELGNSFWTWLFWPTLIWFLLSFPQPVFPLSRWPRLVPVLLYGLPLSAVLINLATGAELPVALALIGELLALLAALVLAAVNAYRARTNAIVRAQATWVLVGFGVSQGLVLGAYLLNLYVPIFDFLSETVYNLLSLTLPVCLGIAIMRYRLFDIDVIIRRTLVYAAITAVLALVYFGSVVILQGVLRGVTGSESPLVVVLSTLLIAALFAPVRARVQRVIDRRFYRRKYDAAHTLAAFGAQARDETDLSQLSARLTGVVRDAMQPAALGLWLKPTSGREAGAPGPKTD